MSRSIPVLTFIFAAYWRTSPPTDHYLSPLEKQPSRRPKVNEWRRQPDAAEQQSAVVVRQMSEFRPKRES